MPDPSPVDRTPSTPGNRADPTARPALDPRRPGLRPALVVCPKNDFTLIDLVKNRVDGRAPDKRLRVGIVMGQVIVDGRHQLLHTTENTPPETLLRQLAEPALDEVEPGGARRREVQFEARVGGQPLANRGVLGTARPLFPGRRDRAPPGPFPAKRPGERGDGLSSESPRLLPEASSRMARGPPGLSPRARPATARRMKPRGAAQR